MLKYEDLQKESQEDSESWKSIDFQSWAAAVKWKTFSTWSVAKGQDSLQWSVSKWETPDECLSARIRKISISQYVACVDQ